jgi:uncharacterized protein YggE
MNGKIIAVFSVSLLLVASAALSAAQDCGPRPRLISAMGTAEINLAPDQVTLSLGVESHDKDLRSARSQNDSRVKKVIALARSEGVELKDIATSALQMAPEYSEEKVPKFLGYEVSQTMDITLRDISKYEPLMTKLLEAGVNRLHNIDFGLSETRKYKDEARLQAVRAAKEKATAMAKELGQTVGKPWEIWEQTGRNAYQAMANSSGYNSPSFEAEGTTVVPGQVTIKASVVVSFQLE